MSEEIKSSTAGVIPADTVTGQEDTKIEVTPAVVVVEPKTEEQEQNPQKSVEGEEEKFDDKAKLTLAKIRDERAQAEVARKAAEARANQLEKQLKDRDEEDAKAQGRYKELWETKTEELLTVSKEKDKLEEKLETVSNTSNETLNKLSTALNQMIDANMANWPDKAKKFVDAAEDVSADTRLSQYLKANDLVSDYLKEAPNPGLAPSPKDIREEGKDKKNDLMAKADSLRASGIYRV